MIDFKKIYKQLQESYRDRIKEGEEEKMWNILQQQALNNLIAEKIVLQQAKKNKVGISNEELFKQVINIKDFRTDKGYFNEALYKRIPSYFRENLEKQKKKEIVRQVFQLRLMDTAKVTDNEVKQHFEIKETKVKVFFIYPKQQTMPESEELLPGISRGKEELSTKIDKFIGAARRSGNFFGAARRFAFKVYRTEFFEFAGKIRKPGTTNEYYNEVEKSYDFYSQAFSLRPNGLSNKIELQNGFVVLLVRSRKEPKWDKYVKEGSKLRAQLLRQRQNTIFYQWYKDVVSRSKIISYMDKIFKSGQ